MQATQPTRLQNRASNGPNTARRTTTMKRVGGGYVPCQPPAPAPAPQTMRMTPAMEIRRLKQRNLQLTRALAESNEHLTSTTAELNVTRETLNRTLADLNETKKKLSHRDGVITDLQKRIQVVQLRCEESHDKLECAVKRHSEDALKYEILIQENNRSKAEAAKCVLKIKEMKERSQKQDSKLLQLEKALDNQKAAVSSDSQPFLNSLISALKMEVRGLQLKLANCDYEKCKLRTQLDRLLAGKHSYV